MMRYLTRYPTRNYSGVVISHIIRRQGLQASKDCATSDVHFKLTRLFEHLHLTTNLAMFFDLA